jgi:hypothetical protein
MNWFRELFKGAYTRLLEEECARLKAENRALLNSLLATAGHAPIAEPEAKQQPARLPVRGMSYHQRQRLTERQSEQRMLVRAEQLSKKAPDA